MAQAAVTFLELLSLFLTCPMIELDTDVWQSLPQLDVDLAAAARRGGERRRGLAGGARRRDAPGDALELVAGATWSGQFALPATAGDGWIEVRSSAHADAVSRVDFLQRSRLARLEASTGSA